ncbi:hypothetical protein Brsp01_31760 [Brucella sp. NBRC 12950]|nr:helix-turn-helix transcriptional regulator [Ochrobactrum sp. BTU1]GLU27943.1 hypothetical protein Brsp01_31760 [Brucella sp. NBRC 12950]
MACFDMLSSNEPVLEVFSSSMNVLSGEWTYVILSNLLVGPMKMDQLHTDIPNADRSVLYRQLEEVERAGLVERLAECDGHYGPEYGITPLGRTLEPILLALQSWCERYEACRQHGERVYPVKIYE